MSAKPRPRRAQLVAEAVAVCCPDCGEPQPNHEGSEMWLREDFAKSKTLRDCAACDRPLLISSDSMANFKG